MTKSAMRVAQQIADIARVPIGERGLFCNNVCDIVETASKQPRRTKSSKPGQALLKAADAARILNEAVCNLNHTDRKWISRVIANDPWLSQEPWLRIAKEPFEIDELNRTVHSLELLFKTSIGKPAPLAPGAAVLSEKRGRKRGAVNDAAFQNFARNLLICVSDGGGTLSLDKNKNSKTGTLVEALACLRSCTPKGLIPKTLPLGTLQTIKTQHLKYRCQSSN